MAAAWMAKAEQSNLNQSLNTPSYVAPWISAR